jgi:hypothetical protein
MKLVMRLLTQWAKAAVRALPENPASRFDEMDERTEKTAERICRAISLTPGVVRLLRVGLGNRKS